MGNTGFRKLLFPGDLVETPYSSLYEIKMMNLNRIEIPFSNFKNKLLLIVNVPKLNKHREEAGEGGKMEKEKKLGKRDEDYLKEILERFKGKIEILAFPCGQFGGTVGNFEEIKESYQEMLGEDFHLFAKVEVNGARMSHLYKFLKKNSCLYDDVLLAGKAIRGDFSKFLIQPDGKVAGYYERNSNNEEIINHISRILEKKTEI